MKADWVKQRSKVIRRILNTLKVEEKEMAKNDILLDFMPAKEELYKLLAEITRMPVTPPPRNLVTWHRREDD